MAEPTVAPIAAGPLPSGNALTPAVARAAEPLDTVTTSDPAVSEARAASWWPTARSRARPGTGSVAVLRGGLGAPTVPAARHRADRASRGNADSARSACEKSERVALRGDPVSRLRRDGREAACAGGRVRGRLGHRPRLRDHRRVRRRRVVPRGAGVGEGTRAKPEDYHGRGQSDQRASRSSHSRCKGGGGAALQAVGLIGFEAGPAGLADRRRRDGSASAGPAGGCGFAAH